MHATIRRYEGVDTTRINDVVSRVDETFVPQIRELSGFAGYFLMEADNGVLSSISLFETSEQADESNKLVKHWISEENFSKRDSERTEDHERQGGCSEQDHPRARLTRPYYRVTERARHRRALSCVGALPRRAYERTGRVICSPCRPAPPERRSRIGGFPVQARDRGRRAGRATAAVERGSELGRGRHDSSRQEDAARGRQA